MVTTICLEQVSRRKRRFCVKTALSRFAFALSFEPGLGNTPGIQAY